MIYWKFPMSKSETICFSLGSNKIRLRLQSSSSECWGTVHSITVSDFDFAVQICLLWLPVKQTYKLSLNRLIKYGETPGCKGCQSLGTPNIKPHSAECKARFSKIFSKTPPELTEASTDDVDKTSPEEMRRRTEELERLNTAADNGSGVFAPSEAVVDSPSQGGEPEP